MFFQNFRILWLGSPVANSVQDVAGFTASNRGVVVILCTDSRVQNVQKPTRVLVCLYVTKSLVLVLHDLISICESFKPFSGIQE